MRNLMLCAIGAGLLAILGTAADAATQVSTAKYSCANGKSLTATYYDRSVEVVLSDGRKLNLPQGESGSGIRYRNADESIVFWSKGKTAFMTEKQATTYADCFEVAN